MAGATSMMRRLAGPGGLYTDDVDGLVWTAADRIALIHGRIGGQIRRDVTMGGGVAAGESVSS